MTNNIYQRVRSPILNVNQLLSIVDIKESGTESRIFNK